MKFTKPSYVPRDPSGVRSSAPFRRPDWLREWLANKSQFVLLSCGHKEDLNHNTMLLIRDDHFVMCVQCDDWARVVESLGLLKYHGIPEPEETDIPLF